MPALPRPMEVQYKSKKRASPVEKNQCNAGFVCKVWELKSAIIPSLKK